ncbi:SH3 domain-containing protein, partial [Vibrio owensii]
MDLAKQFGRSALAIAVVSLSGCQLLQFGSQPHTVSSVMMDDHAESVMVINQQMDQYLSEDGRASFLNQMLVALESDNRNKFKGKDPDTYSWWKIRVQPNQWKEAEVSRPIVDGVDTSKTLEFMDVSY